MKKLLISLLVSMFFATGCQELTVSQYDATTDQEVTQLQKDNTQLFLDMQRSAGTPDFAYTKFQGEYDKLETELQSLKLRVEAIPNNSLTEQEVDLLQKDLDLLQQAHKAGMSISEIVPMQDAMNRIYGAILKLELAKKDMRATSANNTDGSSKSASSKVPAKN